MKHINLRAFEKHLEGAAKHAFSPVYLIVCADRYQREEAVRLLTDKLLHGVQERSLAIRSFAADSPTERLFDELNSMGLLVQRRVVLITEMEKAGKPLLDGLASYLERPSKDVYLVLCGESFKKTVKLYKSVENAGIILEVAEEKPWQKEKTIAGWVAERVSKEGKRIDPQAAQHLVRQLGTDQALLSNEILKLVCYIGDRPAVTMDDVGAISISVNCENSWQLGEAIFKRDAASALRIIKALLDDGTAFLGLLRQIRTQFQTDYQICCVLNNGGTAQDVTDQFPYMKGMILDKHLSMARHYGAEGFKNGLLLIDQTELQAKNSQMDDHFLAERLVVKLTVE